MKLSALASTFAVCRLNPADALPAWAGGSFVSITRTADELSIVCDDSLVPGDVRAERGWSALKVEGPIPFETIGVAASLAAPLAAEGISIILISTFDTDYVLVKRELLSRAAGALRRSGHDVT